MPDNWQVQTNAVPNSSNVSTDNSIEEAMRRLKIQEGASSHVSPYPDRPGEPDCIYYLRTGLCGYGSNCRFNHPVYPGQVAQQRGELPERVGQPDCQYFLKTGTCKFGVTCKYHHPRDRHDAGQVLLNIVGLPMRQEEKSCPYYMRTGTCKFGFACKFHHPHPGAVFPVIGTSAYGSVGSSVASPSASPYIGGLPSWSLPRVPYMSGPRMQNPPAYMPVVLSPSQGIIPAQQGWSTYMSSVTPVASSDAFRSNMLFNSKHSRESGSTGEVDLFHFPERLNQPECQYYMKTGSCKFGPSCKYHHPKERIARLPTRSLTPLGLPLRPGQAVCPLYSMYGICNFSSTCNFDHPMTGYYHYGLSPLSLPEPSLSTYQRNSPIAQSSAEASPSKASKPSDQFSRPESTSTKQENPDTEAADGPPQQNGSSHADVESPKDQSD